MLGLVLSTKVTSLSGPDITLPSGMGQENCLLTSGFFFKIISGMFSEIKTKYFKYVEPSHYPNQWYPRSVSRNFVAPWPSSGQNNAIIFLEKLFTQKVSHLCSTRNDCKIGIFVGYIWIRWVVIRAGVYCPHLWALQGSTLSFLAGCLKIHFLGWYRNFLVYWYLKLDNQSPVSI